MNADLLNRLGEKGYSARIVDVGHLRDLQDDIETNYRNGMYDEGLYRDYLGKFVYSPPKDARSIVVMAWRQPNVRLVFSHGGRRVPVIVPSSYLHTAGEDLKAQETLDGILAPEGYMVSPVRLPKKLLAARGGMATYGRNNITYVDGMGSFHRLNAFYTDLPCGEAGGWRAPVMNVRCESCRACVDHCPSGAIGIERFLIQAERCIVLHNEKPGNVPFPHWIDPSWHNCLFGCLRCQNICPENKRLMGHTVEGEEFSSAETELLLAGTPVEQMPASLVKKLESSDLKGLLDELPRNLCALLERK